MQVHLHLPQKVHHIHWHALAQTLGPILLLSVIAVWASLYYFAESAPPRTITMATGTPGSAYDEAAKRYQHVLEKYSIKLKLVPTQGAIKNLQLLSDPHSGVDVALVQSGLPVQPGTDLVSLGSMFYQPLMIFYRAPKPMGRLAELSGKRVAVGPEGSGTRYIAQALLTANGLGPKAAQLLDLEGEDARQALLHHQVDAIFLTGDSASPETIREMLHTEGIQLFSFNRADAYLRRFTYLHKIAIPAGAFDLGEDLPPADLTVLAPTVEMIARPSLHSALVEVLVRAASKTHNRATLMQAANEFPKPLANDFPLSEAAERYYKSGDLSFLYRYVPFWVASMLNRLWVTLLSLVVIVLPALRYAPNLYSWRIESKIHHRYGQLMALERESLVSGISEERRAALIDRLNEIEHALIGYKIPGSYAEQLYLLRQHISFVRAHLTMPDSALKLHGSHPLAAAAALAPAAAAAASAP